MRRREFIAFLCGAMASAKSVRAEKRQRPLIAFAATASQSAVAFYVQPFLEGMRELGYIEGRDFDMVYRFADGHNERLPSLAAELVQLNPDIFFAGATAQAVILKKLTKTIPIIVAALADPVGLGLVESEAHPGGNLTGISPYVKGQPSKKLELARAVVPDATRIGLVDDVSDPKTPPQRQEIETVGQALGLNILPAEVRTPDDIGPAYEALASEHVEIVIVEQSNMLSNQRKQLAEAAMRKKLPSVYGYADHVRAGDKYNIKFVPDL